jgi:hypothetical protein
MRRRELLELNQPKADAICTRRNSLASSPMGYALASSAQAGATLLLHWLA